MDISPHHPLPCPDANNETAASKLDSVIGGQIDTMHGLLRSGESGPQAIEVTKEELEQMIRSKHAIFSEIDGTELPVLMPLSGVQSFNDSEYYKDKDTSSTFYVPIYGGLSPDQIALIAYDVSRQVASGTNLVTYCEDGDEYANAYIAEIMARIGTVEHQPIIDSKNNTEARVVHFEGLAEVIDRTGINRSIRTLSDVFKHEVAKGRYDSQPQTGTTLLDTLALRDNPELLEKLWTMSDYQFTNVVENLPIRQSPTKEEFFSIITHEDTSNIVYFDDGEPVCLMTFLHSVESADWLRKGYFNQRYGNDAFLSYFAFIVADAKKAPPKSSFKVIQLCSELLSTAQRDMVVVFECTNISADYIPKIVEQVVEAMGTLTVQFNASASYTFRRYRVG